MTPAKLKNLALRVDQHKYVFTWIAGQEAQLLRQFGQMAADPELNFGWYEAAILAGHVRKTKQPD